MATKERLRAAVYREYVFPPKGTQGHNPDQAIYELHRTFPITFHDPENSSARFSITLQRRQGDFDTRTTSPEGIDSASKLNEVTFVPANPQNLNRGLAVKIDEQRGFILDGLPETAEVSNITAKVPVQLKVLTPIMRVEVSSPKGNEGRNVIIASGIRSGVVGKGGTLKTEIAFEIEAKSTDPKQLAEATVNYAEKLSVGGNSHIVVEGGVIGEIEAKGENNTVVLRNGARIHRLGNTKNYTVIYEETSKEEQVSQVVALPAIAPALEDAAIVIPSKDEGGWHPDYMDLVAALETTRNIPDFTPQPVIPDAPGDQAAVETLVAAIQAGVSSGAVSENSEPVSPSTAGHQTKLRENLATVDQGDATRVASASEVRSVVSIVTGQEPKASLVQLPERSVHPVQVGSRRSGRRAAVAVTTTAAMLFGAGVAGLTHSLSSAAAAEGGDTAISASEQAAHIHGGETPTKPSVAEPLAYAGITKTVHVGTGDSLWSLSENNQTQQLNHLINPLDTLNAALFLQDHPKGNPDALRLNSTARLLDGWSTGYVTAVIEDPTLNESLAADLTALNRQAEGLSKKQVVEANEDLIKRILEAVQKARPHHSKPRPEVSHGARRAIAWMDRHAQ